MPLLFVCCVVAYVDRVDVGFARLPMLGDRHFGDAVHGFGAGLFFVGCLFFEVPSNLLLHRLGCCRRPSTRTCPATACSRSART